jgi:DNA polymerase-3 subunit alpha
MRETSRVQDKKLADNNKLKKKMDIMQAERKNFVYGNEELDIAGCIKNGVPEDVANEIYDQMIDFAKYAFNKSHAACYAAIAMQTAYLKAHYPTEFYAGLLTSVMDDTEQLAIYLQDAKRNDVVVLPPDVNSSKSAFSVADEDTLYYGLNSIKKVGKKAIDEIIEERVENGEFKSLYDFIFRCPQANKGLIENLINAGAFDFTNHNRPSLIQNIEVCQKAVKNRAKKVCENQISIFDFLEIEESFDFNEPEVSLVEDWNPVEKAKKEKEATGIFITLHPLEAVELPEKAISVRSCLNSAQSLIQQEKLAMICGIITEKKIFFTKSKGEKMAVLKVEDDQAEIKVIIFPKKYAIFGDKFEENDIVSITGKVNIDEDYEETSIHAESIDNLNVEKSLIINCPNIHSLEQAQKLKFVYTNVFTTLFKSEIEGYSVKIFFKNEIGKRCIMDLGIKVSDIYKAEKIAKKEFGEKNIFVQEKKKF